MFSPMRRAKQCRRGKRFPLGLGRRTIGASRRPSRLRAERFRLTPRHAHHRLSSLPPELPVQLLHRQQSAPSRRAIDRSHGILAEMERRTVTCICGHSNDCAGLARSRTHREVAPGISRHVRIARLPRRSQICARGRGGTRSPGRPDRESRRRKRKRGAKIVGPGSHPLRRRHAGFVYFPQTARLVVSSQ